MIEPLLLLAAALSFVFGWNNSSFLIGNMAGSGILSVRASVILTALGMLAGVLFEGPKMLRSLQGTLAPAVPTNGTALTLAFSLVLMIVLTAVKLPAPMTSAMVGAFLGVAVGLGEPVSLSQTGMIVIFWFVAPLLGVVGAFLLHRATSALVSSLSLVTMDTFNRVGVVLGSVAVAYALGSNNLGLIAGMALGVGDSGMVAVTSALVTGVAVLGVILLGRGSVSGTVGDRMLSLAPRGVFAVFATSALLVWLGTQLAVPISLTQLVLGAMLGAALSQRIAVINTRLAYEALSTWVLVPAAAFVAAYLLTLL
jgi:PiT family inorganic phosphate transporter